MLNSLREGPLTTFFDSDGSAGDYDAVDGSQTVLFRWQGSLVPVQVRKEVQNPNSISKQFYQNGRHFADCIFKCIHLNENV